jgi:hypothetical protein
MLSGALDTQYPGGRRYIVGNYNHVVHDKEVKDEELREECGEAWNEKVDESGVRSI